MYAYTFPEPFCLRLDFVSPRVGFKEVNGSNADNILTYLYFCTFSITSRVQFMFKSINCFSSVSIQRRNDVVSTVMLQNDVTSTQIRRCSDVVYILRGVYMVSVLSVDGVG